VDEVLAWFEASLALRHAAVQASGEPDYAAYRAAADQYVARSADGGTDPVVVSRQENDDEASIAHTKLGHKRLAPKLIFAIAHRGDDRYTIATSSEKRMPRGRKPSWEYHVDKIDGEWRIIGMTSRRSERSTYWGGRHDEAILETRQFNTDQLREDHARFTGEVQVG
jgi:hypothetical protein